MRRDQASPPNDVGRYRSEISGTIDAHRVTIERRDVSPSRINADPTAGHHTEFPDPTDRTGTHPHSNVLPSGHNPHRISPAPPARRNPAPLHPPDCAVSAATMTCAATPHTRT